MGLFGGGNSTSNSTSYTANTTTSDSYNSAINTTANWQNVGNVVVSPVGNSAAGDSLAKSLVSGISGGASSSISFASYIPYLLIGLVVLMYMRHK